MTGLAALLINAFTCNSLGRLFRKNRTLLGCYRNATVMEDN